MTKTKQQLLYLEELINFSKKFKKYKPVIFYGTLLGIQRDNSIIKNDDDLDFLVDYNYKKQIEKDIKKSKKYKVNKKISHKYFTQFFYEIDDITIFIDLYFFTNLKKNKFIIDRHNFFGNFRDNNSSLHIPKKYFYPIKKSNLQKNIFLPNKAKVLCKFLYGYQWKIPLKKYSNYKMKLLNNKPVLIKKNFFSSLVKNLKLFFTLSSNK